MPWILDATNIDALWEALRLPAQEGRRDLATSLLRSVAEHGWARVWEVDDIITYVDPRLVTVDTPALCRAFRLHWQRIHRRADAIAGEAAGRWLLAASDVAQLLINLERLGVPIHATPLVDALVPKLRRRELVDDSELAVLEYAGNGPTMDLLTVQVSERLPRPASVMEVRTTTGYIAQLLFGAHGQSIGLTVHPPAHRPKAEVSRRWRH